MPSKNKQKTDLLQGTLDLIVLQMLQAQPSNGWELTQRINVVSKDVLNVNAGSLYPALYRLEARGYIRSREKMSELGRPAKFYEITPAGRRHLEKERADWLAFSRTVTRLLNGRSS